MIAFLPDNENAIYLGGDGGMYYSGNRGDSWSQLANLPNTQFYAIDFDYSNPERIYGGAQDNRSMRSTGGGINGWQPLDEHDGSSVNVDYVDPDVIYTTWTWGFLRKSVDGGQSFYEIMDGINRSEPARWLTLMVMDPNIHTVLYTATDRVYRSVNRGESWTPFNQQVCFGGNFVTAIAPARSEADVVYVGGSGGRIWVTTNGGTSWTPIYGSTPVEWVSRIAVDPYNAGTAYVAFSEWAEDYGRGSTAPHVWRTTNYGQSWSNITGNLPNAPVNDVIVDFFNVNTLYIGTDVGVFRTTDLGTTWTPYGTGLPLVAVTDLAYHPPTKQLAAGTLGRSIYTITTECNDPTDSDGDGVCDAFDNCPGTSNADQADADLDLVGDICDDCYDTDRDGYGNPGYANACPDDNCPDIYNPDQADSDGNGIGDACMFASVTSDTVNTACTRLAISSRGSYGTWGASLDYGASGDCDGSYMWSGSSIISYYEAIRGNVTAHSWSGANGFRPIFGRAEQVPTVTTPDYEIYETGTMLTDDSFFAMEMTWWSPTGLDDCHFVIQRKKLYRYSNDAVYFLSVGDFVDWDIPGWADKNQGGYDSDYSLIYQYGGPSDNPADDCRDNTRRFGGIAMLGSYSHLDPSIDTDPYSGHVQLLDPHVTNGELDPAYLYSIMHQQGYSVSPDMNDLFNCMTYAGGLSFQPTDTLYTYSAFISILDGTLDDLRTQVDRAKAWADDYLGLYSCCDNRVGNANGSGEDEPTIGDVSVMIDAKFISGTCDGVIGCLAEADINQSGGANPTCDDITIGDVAILIDYLFITGSSLGLPECL